MVYRFSLAQNQTLPGIIPSLFYKGRITNRLDYNIFASTTFIPIKSTIEGKELSPRNSEVYLQPGLIYKYSKELNFAIGYTFINASSFSSIAETRHQVWQQVIFEHKFLKGYMHHRLRLIENAVKDIAPQFNYQIAFEKPLQGRQLDAKEIYFTCFNESFINLSKHPTNILLSNWLFVGIGYKTSSIGNFEFGPLIQAYFNNEDKSQNTLLLFQLLWLTDYKLHDRQKSN